MNKKTDLTIIIISSNKSYLFDCLDSVKEALGDIQSEIVFIDNASQDKLGDKAKLKYPGIRVIRREANGGFGENNNIGIREANGRYILLLNDDTKIIDRNVFKEMVLWMDEHPKAGLATCALVNPDLKTHQGSGGYFSTLFRVFAWMTFLDDVPGFDNLIKPYHPLHSGSPLGTNEAYFKKAHKQDWLTGAYLMMRKKAVDEVGLFDEDFFLYVEEVELAFRFAEEGWEAWYLPQWKVLHYGMVTSGSEKATIFELQNLILMYKKHKPNWEVPVLRAILKFGVVLRMLLWNVGGKPDLARIYAKAYKSV